MIIKGRKLIVVMMWGLFLTNLACQPDEDRFRPSSKDVSIISTAGETTVDDEKIERLRRIVPGKPKIVADPSIPKTMWEAAETRQPEALNLLIDSLAFNFDPDNTNEKNEQAEMIPAIAVIKDYFGESASTALYQRGITTEKEWLTERIALAIRVILPNSTTDELARRAAHDLTRPRARKFSELLLNPNLKVRLARRQDEFEEIDRKIEAKRKQSNRSN